MLLNNQEMAKLHPPLTSEVLTNSPIDFFLSQVLAVIVSPTRELSSQIYNVAQPFFATLKGMSSMVLVGGLDIKAELKRVDEQGANILVGTPGKLCDVMQREETLDFKNLEVVLEMTEAYVSFFLI